MNNNQQPKNDTSETIHLSPLALMKMLKHARAGVPMEVMGLLLGEFVDDYTTRIIDVFSMPQSGSAEAVEAVDEVYQTKMLALLSQTHRYENVIGWYHSHPSYGCWLSSTDMQTQSVFERINERCVAVVIDPIQSVKGKVVIDAFRLCDPRQTIIMNKEPRQITSNIGSLNKPSRVALAKGLNKHYYSIGIDNKGFKNKNDLNILQRSRNKHWNHGLTVDDFDKIEEENKEQMTSILDLSQRLNKRLNEESKNENDANKDKIRFIGKVDPRKRLNIQIEEVLKSNIIQNLGAMLNATVVSSQDYSKFENFARCRDSVLAIKDQRNKPVIVHQSVISH